MEKGENNLQDLYCGYDEFFYLCIVLVVIIGFVLTFFLIYYWCTMEKIQSMKEELSKNESKYQANLEEMKLVMESDLKANYLMNNFFPNYTFINNSKMICL